MNSSASELLFSLAAKHDAEKGLFSNREDGWASDNAAVYSSASVSLPLAAKILSQMLFDSQSLGFILRWEP